MAANDTNLTGRVALVTGGAKRVGRQIALTLAAAGMDVAITYQSSESDANALVAEIQRSGRRAAAIAVNLAQPDAADIVHRAFAAHFDRLDALVNNAAIFDRTPLGDVTTDQFDLFMAVNARAPLLLIQKFAPMLAAHADPDQPHTLGRIVNLIDIHATAQTAPGYAAYAASKAALRQITQNAALELAPKITVNAIAPGAIEWADFYDQAARRRYLQRVPLGRPGSPHDAAAAVLYLVRDAHYCTGQVITIDGGRSLT